MTIVWTVPGARTSRRSAAVWRHPGAGREKAPATAHPAPKSARSAHSPPGTIPSPRGRNPEPPMKLECLQENLAEGLAVVGRVVPAKSTLPVLSNVLISTRDTELQLTANNLELSVAHRVPATVARQGEITLPARLLTDYVALLDHGQKVDLDLNPKTHKVHLVCGRYEANVAGIDAEDFPPIPQVSGG